MEYMAFPWMQLGGLLRSMSLAGALGNAAAWILYATVSVSPLALWGYYVKKKKCGRMDWLLAILSAALFVSLWFLTNPSYIEYMVIPAEVGFMGGYAFAAVIDSILLAWLLIHYLEKDKIVEKKVFLRLLQLLLGLWCLLAAAAAVCQKAGEIMEGFQALNGNKNGLDMLFLILGSIVSWMPGVLELALLVLGICFLHSCEREDFGEENLKWIERMEGCSRRFLNLILIGNAAFNILQMAFARKLSAAHYGIFLPLREVITVLVILLLSRFYLESKRMKDDNDLFI